MASIARRKLDHCDIEGLGIGHVCIYVHIYCGYSAAAKHSVWPEASTLPSSCIRAGMFVLMQHTRVRSAP